MTALPRAGVPSLEPDAHARLEALLEAEAERVAAACRAHAFASPVCNVALIYVLQDHIPWVSYAFALTELAREAAFERDGEQALWVLWSPADWDHRLVLSDHSSASLTAARRVARDLHKADLRHNRGRDAQGAFLCELAFRLSRRDWRSEFEVTDDFACWAGEHDLTDDVFATFEVTAPPVATSLYRQRRWLRFPDTSAL